MRMCVNLFIFFWLGIWSFMWLIFHGFLTCFLWCVNDRVRKLLALWCHALSNIGVIYVIHNSCDLCSNSMDKTMSLEWEKQIHTSDRLERYTSMSSLFLLFFLTIWSFASSRIKSAGSKIEEKLAERNSLSTIKSLILVDFVRIFMIGRSA